MYCNGNCYGLVCKSCTSSDSRKIMNSTPGPIYLSPAASQMMANQAALHDRSQSHQMRALPAVSSPFLHPGFKFATGFQRVCFGGGPVSAAGTIDNPAAAAAAAAYFPSPLTSPALMALASSAAVAAAAAAAHHDNNASSPAGFSPDKEHQTPVTGPITSPITSVFPGSLRSHIAPPHGADNGELASSNGIPSSLLPSSHTPNFLSPDLSRTPSASSISGGGAFKPLVSDDVLTSAFVPPNKCPKIEPGEDSGGQMTVDRSGVATPVSTDGSESGHRSTPEEGGRRLRGKKRSALDSQAPCCPVCGVTVRSGELLHHFAQEVERLQHISKSTRRCSSRDGLHNRFLTSPNSSRRRSSPSTSSSDSKNSSTSRWDTYQRVRTNRTNRLGIKACKGKQLLASHQLRRKFNDDSGTPSCPVCGDKLNGNSDEMNMHVEMCLRKKEMLGSEDENVDIDSSDRFEEYEWAGQTRIRASALLEGGYSGSGLSTASKMKEEEDDTDLNVDVDDSATFGTAQYSEADIIPCSSDEPGEQKQRNALRDAVLGGENTKHATSECSKWTSKDGSSDENNDGIQLISDVDSASTDKNVVESLKRKLKEINESAKIIEKLKCLICMEQYANPLVSVSCWHVHCEECWLRTLGAKKLCPQCNMITSPSDLRRVYL